MIITFNNEKYEFDDKLCNAYEKILGLPISGNDIGMYLTVYTKQDPEVALRTLSSKEIVYIVEKCIKDEIIDIYGEETLNKYIKERKENE